MWGLSQWRTYSISITVIFSYEKNEPSVVKSHLNVTTLLSRFFVA
ncbi:MAG: hypothetical protein N2114_00975 [Candidatus Goldbacteria bacterium]|nr:hypothetical protein [Candidatus Goldiibacteriota bacterium]